MKEGAPYQLEITVREEAHLEAWVCFFADHGIYGGHFPGFPITPGVCQIRLVREALEGGLGRSFHLAQARSIKFLHMHDPSVEAELSLELDYREVETGIRVDAQLKGATQSYFKMKGIYRAD
jgi:3-hydroxyacyl-[acyl-carrier-protein] dehydratase